MSGGKLPPCREVQIGEVRLQQAHEKPSVVGDEEMEEFVEMLETKFNIPNKQVYYIIEDIMRENFLTEPGLLVGVEK